MPSEKSMKTYPTADELQALLNKAIEAEKELESKLNSQKNMTSKEWYSLGRKFMNARAKRTALEVRVRNLSAFETRTP